MKNELVAKPASQNEMTLYCFMGEALCMIQELEEALSHSIILKKRYDANKEEADKALSKHRRRYTLGQAVNLAAEEKLYSSLLQGDLIGFYDRRNWLVHRAMFENRDDLYSDHSRKKLLHKIKSIADDAQKLQHAIELDMVDFCTSKGRDMSKVLAEIEARYNE